MSDAPRLPIERLGYAALAVLTLSPVVLQGLWPPFVRAPYETVDSAQLAGAALGIAAAAALATGASLGRASRRWLPAACAGLVALALGLRWGQGPTLALLGVAAFSGALSPWLVARLPAGLDGRAREQKVVAALLVLLGVVTVATTTRLSVFMGDSSRPELSLAPDSTFLVTHACLTAYVQGARLAAQGVVNLYDTALWPHLDESAAAYAAPYAPFGLDSFAYPPPFLLLPQLLLAPLRDFAAQRALWFALNGLLLAAGFWVVSRWIGGRAGQRALLLAPLVWIAQPTLVTLQVGNVHVAMVVAVMLALVAFETRRPAAGGALLAFAILSKVSPGLLVVLLLFQRRFREVAWTAAWGLVFVLLSVAVFGVAPIEAFLRYELPRLSSGEAMTFLAWPESVAINVGPFGVPFKLELIGIELGDAWAIGRGLGKVYTVVILGLTVLAARRRGGPRSAAEVWLATITLASLQSPLAPGYVLFSLIWLLSIRAIDVRGWPEAVGAALIWIAMSTGLPGVGVLPLTVGLLQQGLMFGVVVYFLLRRTVEAGPPAVGVAD